MILRPLDPTTAAVVQEASLEQPASTEKQFAPAWQIVEQVQRATYETCWIITQPSHAALAGDIAAKLVLPAYETRAGCGAGHFSA